MSNLSAPEIDETFDDQDRPAPEPLAGPVEIHRNGRLAAAVGTVAAGVAAAYLARALGGGSWLDWALGVAMALVAAAYLSAFVDSRAPLLVADAQGVRLRLGRTWRGLPWSELECVEHEPRRGAFHDGHLTVVVEDGDALLADLDAAGRRHALLAQRLHGSPLAIPLGLSTRVSGAGDDLTLALERLAGDPDRVVEILDDAADLDEGETWDGYDDQAVEPHDEVFDQDAEWESLASDPIDSPTEGSHHPVLSDPRPALARGIDQIAELLRLRRPAPEEPAVERPAVEDEPAVEMPAVEMPAVEDAPATVPIASATPSPLREPVTGTRAEVRFDSAPALQAGPTESDLELTAAWTVDWEDRVDQEAGEPSAVEVPMAEPVVGGELAAARIRLHLSVDQLAERTRIRPHVIESIEVDDFAPCGGDFYARGHLRTLARVLGVDAVPLLTAYDERYADAPIDARRVFEAELATGADGPIRSTRGGPNWSVLVAAVMALVLAWSIARLIMDSPVEVHSKPVLNGSPSQTTDLGPAVPVVLDASGGGAHVVVKDGAGELVFSGDLAFGATKTIKATPPVRIQSSDGGLRVTVDGQKRGALGADGQPASNTFAAAS